jgi:cytochrome c peroxidase
LEKELRLIPEYVKRFDKAFNEDIRSSLILKAIGQFERTLISSNSRYDKYKRKEPGATLTDLELQGLVLVEQKCKTCHSTELFTDHSFHNNGIDEVFSKANDGIFLGRSRVTNNPADIGKFKTPSLRNVAFTAPFMHDGRFNTLQEVLDHYSSGIKSSATLDNALIQNSGKPGIPLTASDKTAIIAFLGALTDDTLLYGIKISNPHL